MAEKYGTIPPKFTKAWWTYFWDYYKWYVIGILFAIICIAVTAVQCATKERYDITVTYGGKMIYDEEQNQKVKAAFSPLVEDVDGNGEQNVFFSALTISGEKGQEQYDYALQTKLDLQLQDDTAYIFMFDKNEVDMMLNRDYVSDLYVPVSEWGVAVPEDMQTLASKDGGVFAVDLTNSKFLNEQGIYCKDTYAVLKINGRKDETAKKAYESSLNIMQKILAN